MKNTTRKKLLKVVTAVATLGIVAAVSFSATFAYLTARTERKVNTFSSGGVDIELTEPNFDPDHRVEYKPGDTIVKDPMITTLSDEATYVAAVVTCYKEISKEEYDAGVAGNEKVYKVRESGKDVYYQWILPTTFERDIATLNFNEDRWAKPSKMPSLSSAYVFYYKGLESELAKLEKNKNTESLFTQVKFNKESRVLGEGEAKVGGNSIPNVKILVTAFAVRASSYENVGAAKNALNALIEAHFNEIKLTGDGT